MKHYHFCTLFFPSLVLLVFVLPFSIDANEIETLDYAIAASFPSPGPNPQGLAWDGSHLWVSDDDTDMIYKVDPINGAVLHALQSPGNDPRGLTWDGDCICVSDQNDYKIYRLHPESGAITESIDADFSVSSTDTRPLFGLAWDGSNFWCSVLKGYSSKILQIDKENNILRSFFEDAQDIAIDGNIFWYVDSQYGASTGIIKKRELPSFKIIALFRTPGYYPTGLSWDGDCLWLADCGADSLYKIEILTTGVESPAPERDTFIVDNSFPNPFNVTTTIPYTITVPSTVTVTLYDITGHVIKKMYNGFVEPGCYTCTWDGTDQYGDCVSNGVFLCVFKVNNRIKTRKMLLLK